MKIGITGTTSGIGRAILQLPYKFIKFDRKDGDIHDLNAVYEKLKNCDVFINNAWDKDCQTKLLKFFFDKWRDDSKKIISIGSSVASYDPTGPGYEHYVDCKRQLRNTHCDIVNTKTNKCRSYLVNPGVTDTKMTADKDAKKMTAQEVGEIIKFVLENKLYISEIYFHVE